MLTYESGMMNQLTPAQQQQLRHANRRWVICLSNQIVERETQNYNLATVAELFVKYQVNIILICFDPSNKEKKAVDAFVQRINILSADKIMPIEAYPLFDPTPEDVENLMKDRVANYKIPKNAPLIIETFM